MDTDRYHAADLHPTLTLARLYEKQGLLDEAAAVYKKLVAMEPHRQDLREALEYVERRRQGTSIQARESEPETILSQLAQWQTAISSRKEKLDESKKTERRILVIQGQERGKQDWPLGDEVPTEPIEKQIKSMAETCGASAETFQSTGERELIQKIIDASSRYDGIVINPAGLTHCIEAIKDALMMLDIPVVEVHLSNIWSEESLGRKSSIADVATAHIAGFGQEGYVLAVRAIADMTTKERDFGSREL